MAKPTKAHRARPDRRAGGIAQIGHHGERSLVGCLRALWRKLGDDRLNERPYVHFSQREQRHRDDERAECRRSEQAGKSGRLRRAAAQYDRKAAHARSCLRHLKLQHDAERAAALRIVLKSDCGTDC
jgi:hypothetical protein